MTKQKAPEILRLKIKETAQNLGIFDKNVPSRVYCAVTIQVMSALLGMSVTDITNKIESQQPSS